MIQFRRWTPRHLLRCQRLSPFTYTGENEKANRSLRKKIRLKFNGLSAP
jgi:hypothetical protein